MNMFNSAKKYLKLIKKNNPIKSLILDPWVWEIKIFVGKDVNLLKMISGD